MNKLSQVAAMVKKAGATGTNDTVLAHITPNEAALLKARGGSGEIDPETGLPHFDDGGSDSSESSETQYSAPTYNNGGYYSAAGSYAGGNDQDANPTRYYNYRQTIGGNIANSLGFDPEGTLSKITNAGIGAIGMINPLAGIVGKIAQAGAASQSVQSPSDMDGNGGSMNMLGRLVANGSPAASALSKIPIFQSSQVSLKDTPDQFSQGDNNQNSRTSTVQSAFDDIRRRRQLRTV